MLEFSVRKGVQMLVSALSAISGSSLKSQNLNYGSMTVNRAENLLVDNYKVNALQILPENRSKNVFDSINQWKAFCHRQILGGKLDIIA